MPLISTVNLSKSFGPNDIFTNVTGSIPHRARIGLVGPNGVGKTTLLHILIGSEEPSGGEVQRTRGLQIGYLPQEVRIDSTRTLWDECLNVFSSLLDLQKELHQLESSMSDSHTAENTLETYGRLQIEFERKGGYLYENRIRQTLTGLGFAPEDFKRPLQQLSGGQRTRAFLARLLLSDSDLLLLDEPTNHLDIGAIEWLESYLKDWDGAVLIVSHDRYFLDQVVDSIWEMTPNLETYRGNYSAYLTQRAERYQRRLEEFQVQQTFIEKEEEYIRRNIAGQNTRQAQGRRKRLERMLEEARITPPPEPRRLHLKLEPVNRSGDLVLRTSDLSIGYEDEGRPLFHVPDLVLQRSECAAIIGPNGAGKTTFLKTLLEQIPPYNGEVTLGASLKIGYFAQAHEGLHADWTLMQEVEAVAPGMLPAAVRDYLAKFLFTGDDVFKVVGSLSGGERGRLALACLALQGSNLLLLDEPTNHLDLASQEVLQAILAEYSGTILLVSHDRYLIDALATQIWEVLPAEERLNFFNGTYSEYRASRQIQEAAARAAEPEKPKEARERSRANTGLSKGELRKKQQHLTTLEEKIGRFEEKLAAISRELEKPPADSAKVQRMGQEYLEIQTELERLLEEWAVVSDELAEIKTGA